MGADLRGLPDSIPAAQVNDALKASQAGYSCPLCAAQNTRDPADTGWVECPLLNRRRMHYICFGCCVDIAGTTAAENFGEHAYRDIVESAADEVGLTTIRARRICVQHQVSILRQKIQAGRDDGGTYELLQRLQTLDESLDAAEREETS